MGKKKVTKVIVEPEPSRKSQRIRNKDGVSRKNSWMDSEYKLMIEKARRRSLELNMIKQKKPSPSPQK